MADRPLGQRCLDAMVASGCPPCGVVSRDDTDEQWWGRPAFRARCRALGLPWYDHRGTLETAIARLRPDLLVSILFTRIVPADLLARTPGVNLHCAPLPAHAGFNATLWAILEGRRRFGASLHVMTEKVDAGPLVDSVSFAVPEGITNAELYSLAHSHGLALFERNLKTMTDGRMRSVPQRGHRRYRSRDLPPRQVSLSWAPQKVQRYARAFYFPPFEPAFFVHARRKVHLVPETRHLTPAALRTWGLTIPGAVT